MADDVSYINNHTLCYLVLHTDMGQRKQRWMVAVDGGDPGGAPVCLLCALPGMLIGGVADVVAWVSCLWLVYANN